MKYKVHDLKTWPEHYWDVVSGVKKVEIRKEDDKTFKVDDILRLREYVIDQKEYTGELFTVKVTHVLRGEPWLPIGYAAISISPIFIAELREV